MNFLQILVTNKKDFKIEREKPQTKWAWSLLIKCPWVTSDLLFILSLFCCINLM